ncbi:MAG: cell division protein FtsL [Hyphomicrobiales bacterium]|nr:cell division protein FtsL [Hyphomicrobiales bacterium]
MRFLTVLAFGIWVGLAFLIYDKSYDARRLEARAATLNKAIAEERENLAVARAEWSHATRPERLETLARDVLKLEPVKAEQLVVWRPGAAATGALPEDGIAALIGRSAKALGAPGHDASR